MKKCSLFFFFFLKKKEFERGRASFTQPRINDYCADDFHTRKLCNQNNRFIHSCEYFTLECLRQNGFGYIGSSDSMPQCEVLREKETVFIILLLLNSRICIFRSSFARFDDHTQVYSVWMNYIPRHTHTSFRVLIPLSGHFRLTLLLAKMKACTRMPLPFYQLAYKNTSISKS